MANDTNDAMGASGAVGAEATPLIEFRDVVFSYAGHTVVDGVSLQVDRGELVALLGPNGCGKTTIMRLINGLELADAGAYLFDGHVIDAAFLKDSAAAQRFHQRVGFVFQNADAQLFCATVGEEIAFGPAQMGLPADELERLNIERFERYETVKAREQRAETFMCEDAEIVLVSFGATARIAHSAVVRARAEGIKAGLLRPITLWPFPVDAIEGCMGRAKAFLSVEMNMGQMVDDVRLAVNGRVPVEFFGRTGGIIPTPDEVLDAIRKLAGKGGE